MLDINDNQPRCFNAKGFETVGKTDFLAVVCDRTRLIQLEDLMKERLCN
jgi:hypothetical protein